MTRTRHLAHALRAFLPLLVIAASAACDDDDDDDFDDVDVEAEQALEEGQALGVELADQLAAELGGDPATVDPAVTIGTIGDVTGTINDGEILQAELAFERAQTDQALGLAEVIFDDHVTANQQLEAVFLETGVAPIENPVSAMLAQTAVAGREQLATARADDFDRQYALMQIEMHATGEVILEESLGWTDDPAFEEYLEDLLDAIRDHLDRSIEVARQLQ